MASKNSFGSNMPIEIARGGTNASSMTTSTGVIVYDGTSLGTNTLKISAAGEMTNASQPAFRATPAGLLANVTGDGTVYTIVFATEIYDQNNDFDGTSTFTASATGKYHFDANCEFGGVAAGHTSGAFWIAASNRSAYNAYAPNKIDNNNLRVSFNISIDVDMDAADTCVINISVTGAAKAIAVVNGDSTTFTGHLIC